MRPAIAPRIRSLLAALVMLAPALASAQDADTDRVDRFFTEKVEEDQSKTVVQGSLTASTFVSQEIGDSIQPDTVELADNASPVPRVFTDLRARLGVRSIAGGALDARVDARLRYVLPCTFETGQTDANQGLRDYDQCRTQSGSFGGNEFEVRELYATRAAGELDIYAGRVIVGEIAATKIDGVRADYRVSDQWSIIGFGGLYPNRISRSVLDDYLGPEPLDPNQSRAFVLPVAVGAGGAYRYSDYFGSVGAAGIIPVTESVGDLPRTFVTSNGYWRPSPLLDLYHFAVIDVTGEATDEVIDRFTNVSIGANIKPTADLRVTAALHQFSTETLEEYAVERLDQVPEQGRILNHVEVLRVSTQSARVGVSLALMEKRFEISTEFTVRRHPPETVGGGESETFEAISGEAMLAVVDRRSIGGLRLGARVANSFGLYDLGLGDDAYGRANFLLGRIDASRSFMSNRVQVDADVTYLRSQDAGDNDCNNNGLACYGATSAVNTITLGTTVFYRFLPDWFAMLTFNGGLQQFDAAPVQNMDETGSNILLSGFLRAAYRF
ncbi:hypothetical protein [Haliangium sp.]|uniref:hypothetical protein n=1 Tax=Haliangium sp. TaxID=2663208 RepID=UPI003D0F065B